MTRSALAVRRFRSAHWRSCCQCLGVDGPNLQPRGPLIRAPCHLSGEVKEVRQPQGCRKLRAGIEDDADPDLVHLSISPPLVSIVPMVGDMIMHQVEVKKPQNLKGAAMSKRAVVVIDLQNEYWPNGGLPLENIEGAAANAARVIAHGRGAGDLVVNVRHEMPGGPVFVPGSEGAAINAVVAPGESEPVITKNFPNSFRETGLKDLLNEKGIEEVVVVGAMSHMCVDATVRAANDLGYRTVTIHDACATRDLEFNGATVPAAHVHTALMAAFEFAYGEVVATDDFIAR